jgi:twitching motility protein PilI
MADTEERALSEVPPTEPPQSVKSRRRSALWEFQRKLVERTRLAQGATDNKNSRLAVQAGSGNFLLTLTQTGEVLPVSPVTTVPMTKAWFLGLTNCRGNLVGVVDLAGFSGMPIAPSSKADRFLVLADSLSTHCALRVSRVAGLVDLSVMQLQTTLPATAGRAGPRYLDSDARSWIELDLAAMANDPAFLDISL